MTTQPIATDKSIHKILSSIRTTIQDDLTMKAELKLPSLGADSLGVIDLTQEVLADGSVREVRPIRDSKSGDSLLSQRAFQESVAALSALQSAKPDPTSQQSGTKKPITTTSIGIHDQTVEELVREALTPLLKEWLDANLPSLVKWMVVEQIEKIFKATQK